MASQLNMTLHASRSLADEKVACRVFEMLNDWKWPPERFDAFEPIKKVWSGRSEFVALWQEQGKVAFGQVMVRRRTRISYYGSVLMLFGPTTRFHSISLYGITESACSNDVLAEVTRLADDLFVELGLDYGRISLKEEFDGENVIKNFRHPDGTIEPRRVVGMNWPECIPGVYWTNYFGSRYLDQGFGQNRHDLEGVDVQDLSDSGFRVRLSDSLTYFRDVGEASELKSVCRQLGPEWFFSQHDEGKIQGLECPNEELRAVPRP